MYINSGIGGTLHLSLLLGGRLGCSQRPRDHADITPVDFIFVVPLTFVGLTDADTKYPPSTTQADGP
jgi:hypothetical protein